MSQGFGKEIHPHLELSLHGKTEPWNLGRFQTGTPEPPQGEILNGKVALKVILKLF